MPGYGDETSGRGKDYYAAKAAKLKARYPHLSKAECKRIAERKTR